MEDEEISDTQNDPVVHELFEDAIEVLRLLGADEKFSGKVVISSSISDRFSPLLLILFN